MLDSIKEEHKETLPDDFEPNTVRKTEEDGHLGTTNQLDIDSPLKPSCLTGPGFQPGDFEDESVRASEADMSYYSSPNATSKANDIDQLNSISPGCIHDSPFAAEKNSKRSSNRCSENNMLAQDTGVMGGTREGHSQSIQTNQEESLNMVYEGTPIHDRQY